MPNNKKEEVSIGLIALSFSLQQLTEKRSIWKICPIRISLSLSNSLFGRVHLESRFLQQKLTQKNEQRKHYTKWGPICKGMCNFMNEKRFYFPTRTYYRRGAVSFLPEKKNKKKKNKIHTFIHKKKEEIRTYTRESHWVLNTLLVFHSYKLII